MFSVLCGLMPGMVIALSWRGFMVPELVREVTSYTKVSLITRLLWAVCHFPILLYGHYWGTCLVKVMLPVGSITFDYTWFCLQTGSF